MNTRRCSTCCYYREIEDNVGQCILLAVRITQDVAIIDRRTTLEMVKKGWRDKNYNGIVVQASFGCIGHNIRARLENQNSP